MPPYDPREGHPKESAMAQQQRMETETAAPRHASETEPAEPVRICTRGLLRGHDTISEQDYEAHPGLREMIARSPEWRYSANLFAWVRDMPKFPEVK